MARKKRFPPGPCVHCLQHCEVPTIDHVFPESWYPLTSRAGLEKWKMPACRPCNETHGRNEKNLMIRFGLCLPPGDEASKGIAERALRAVSPRFGRNRKDRIARAKLRDEILGSQLTREQLREHRASILPGFDRPELPEDERIGINVPRAGLMMLAEKIVRGIYFIEDGLFLDGVHAVRAYPWEETPAPIADILARWGGEYSREPGIRVVRAVPPDDRLSCMFSIEIWGGRLRLAGALMPTEMAIRHDQAGAVARRR